MDLGPYNVLDVEEIKAAENAYKMTPTSSIIH